VSVRKFIPFLVSLLCLLPFAPHLINSSLVLVFRDLSETDLPAKTFWLSSVMKYGQIPYWNYLQGGGSPVISDLVSGPLYPLNLIFLLLGESRILEGLMSFLFAHYYLIFWGSFLLFRSLGFSRNFSSILALTCALNGFSISAHNLTHVLAGVTAMPWFYFFWIRYLDSKEIIYLIGASVAIAWPIYSGDPQFSLVLAFSSVFYGVLNYGPKRALGSWMALGILSLLAAAPQLVPSVNLFLQSTRFAMTEGSGTNSAIWAMHPYRLVEFLIPNFFGFYTEPSSFLAKEQTGVNVKGFFINSIYCGAFTGVSLVWYFISGRAFRKRRLRGTLLVGGSMALAALISMGSWLKPDLYTWVGKIIPLWANFRYPERVFVYSMFLAILLSGYGMRALVAQLRILGRRREGLFSFLMVGAFYILFFTGAFILLRRIGGNPAAVWGESTVIILCVFSMYLIGRKPKYLLPFLLVMVAAGFLRALPGALEFQSRAVSDVKTYPSVGKIIEDLKKRAALRKTGAPDRTLSTIRGGVYTGISKLEDRDVSNFEKNEIARWEALSGNISTYFGIPSIQGHYSLEIGNKHQFIRYFLEKDYSHLANLMGVYYLLARDEGGNLEVRVNPTALDNFRFFSFFDTASSEQEELRMVSLNKEIKSRVVLLAGSLGAPLISPGALVADLIEAGPRGYTFEIESKESGNALFLLNSTWMAGWEVKWNGSSVPVFRANGWAMATFLKGITSGRHRVEFIYNDKSILYGKLLSAVWLLIATVLLFLGYRRKRAQAFGNFVFQAREKQNAQRE
jgi:hypothetical protein